MVRQLLVGGLRSAGLLGALTALADTASGQSPWFATLHRGVPVQVLETSALASGDLDGDGDGDVLVGNLSYQGFTNSVDDRLWLNDGTGAFVDATAGRLPNPSRWTRAIALGDLDGDGDLDAVFGHCLWTSGGVRGALNGVLINDGTAAFTDETSTRLPPIQGTATSLALGDVDRDGDLDLLVGNQAYNMFGSMYGGQNRLLKNDGSGHFTDATAQCLPADDTQTTVALAFGDVDGDSDLDVLVGHDDRCLLLLNDGSGHFTDVTSARLPGSSDLPRAVSLVDVDADGDLDAVLAHHAHQSGGVWVGGQSRVYRNDGTGHFSDVTATAMPARQGRTTRLELGDFDGDGDTDLLLGERDDNRLYCNDGTGHFSGAPSAPWLGRATVSMAALDADGDGDLDVLVGNAGGTQLRMFWNDGHGAFHDATEERVPDDALVDGAIVLGDLDGDGDADALVTSAVGSVTGPFTLVLWRNDGLGGFVDATAGNLPRITDGSTAMALGDVDHDGDLDALVGHSPSAGPSARLLRNDGSARFTDVSASRLPAIAGDVTSVVFVDVDADGDLDALLAAGARNRLLRNDGTGTFVDDTAVSLPAQPNGSSLVGVADVDVDGDLDVVLSTHLGLWLNSGTGTFTDVSATHMPPFSLPSTTMALGDVDGDGDVDLVLGTGVEGVPMQDQLLLGDGTGHFTNATAGHLPALAGRTLDVALADVDEDGDLDLLAAVAKETRVSSTLVVSIADRMRLWRNDGNAVFTDASLTRVPCVLDYTRRLGIADLDGDGDLDVVLGNRQRDAVLTNLRRQVAWRSLPRVGKLSTLEVRGRPNELFLLAASRAPAAIPLGALGTLRIDPSALVFTHAAPCDAEGVATYSFQIPTDPGLVGVSLHWQALVSNLLRLTGAEVTQVTVW